MFNIVSIFVFSEPLCPCEQSVGYRQHKHRDYEENDDECYLLCRRVVGHLSYLLLFQRWGIAVNHRNFGQHLVAPLLYYSAVLQQQQTRITPYDGLQRCAVGVVDGVVGTRLLSPLLYVLCGT